MICLANSSSGSPDDQHWAMGYAEGINFVTDNEDISKKHLKVLSINNDNIPSTFKILNRIMAGEIRLNAPDRVRV